MLEVSDSTATSDVLCVENLIHLRPRLICSPERIPVDKVEIIAVQFRSAGEVVAGEIASMGIVESLCRGADDLVSTDEDARAFAEEVAADITPTFDCLPQRLLGQLVHITIQLLYRGEEMIRDVVVHMAADVFELDSDGEVVDQFTKYTNKISVRLFLSQLLFRIIFSDHSHG